jgi:aconitate hydratase
MTHPYAKTLQSFQPSSGKSAQLYSLPALRKQFANIGKLPVSLRIVLESVLRHCDGQRITPEHVKELANWQPNAPRSAEIPFVVSRVVLQDFTGVPLLADLAAMRNAALRAGKDPKRIEPLVPVDLVVDHSVTVDHYGNAQALDMNMRLEFQRNKERYQFMKWGMQAFDTFKVVPPGFGIVHQVNLEYLARGVFKTQGKNPSYYPDSLVGTDSHTTMINGMGVVGWGVGGIEAEAAMLGQPVYFLTPDVVGFKFVGALRAGVTATDLVLTVTEQLRKAKVVGKFVEFFGPGTASLSLPDRATIANMAPEYGATMGFFPVDAKTLAYLRGTGRSEAEIEALAAYFKAQGMYGIPGTAEFDKVNKAEISYSDVLTLDLGTVAPSLAGPKRPQDRIEITDVAQRFEALFSASVTAPGAQSGFGQNAAQLQKTFKTADGLAVKNGDVLIAAITSCTNTSNPSVLLAAGLLAKKAVARGLKVQPHIKTSLAPGSRIVEQYLKSTGLLPYLEQLGFYVAGFGCTTCIGNAGDLTPALNDVITQNDLVCAAVLSGNRNFEARIHPNLKANFLASPPLVVAYAIAGNMRVDLMTEPVGQGKNGPVYLGDIWPTSEEVDALMKHAMKPAAFKASYGQIAKNPGELWQRIAGKTGQVYDWPTSSYIAQPPFFADFSIATENIAKKPMNTLGSGLKSLEVVQSARVMALFGDSITTDHISPAGSIKASSPAGVWLQERGVKKEDFNSYGARRGHHDVMMRGTFANVRIKNLMIPAKPDGTREEGGVTLHQPSGEKLAIFDAAQRYQASNTPTVIFAGEEYGTGSSRDWAAKGTALLGIKAVVAKSFERIHRSNLVGMGVLPLQFKAGQSWEGLGLRGDETLSIALPQGLKPQTSAVLTVQFANGSSKTTELILRIDTPIEVAYFEAGGILPYVLRDLLK